MSNRRAYLACISIVFIWSGWITISRYGVRTVLQPADITLLRYVTALLCVSPLVFRHNWSKYSLFQYLAVALCCFAPRLFILPYLLDETLNSFEFTGITGCSIGLFIYARGQLLELQKKIVPEPPVPTSTLSSPKCDP